MGDSYKAKTSLDYYWRELQNIKFNELGKLTLPDGFLSRNDWVYVNAHDIVNNAEHMRRLTEMLKSKTDQFVRDFKRFCTILETSGYGDLAFKLKKKAGLPSQTWYKSSQSLHRERSKSKRTESIDRVKRPRSVDAQPLSDTNSELPSTALEQLTDKVSELQKLVEQNFIVTVESVDVKFSVKFTNAADLTVIHCNFRSATDMPVKSRSECTSPHFNLSDSLDGSIFNGYGSPPGTSTPIPGPHSRNSSHSSNHAAEETVSRFLRKHKKAMLEKMVVKEIVGKLSNKDLLSESIVHSIEEAKDNYSANSVLWNHASTQYEFEDCLMLCETLESAAGYPKMRKLGKQMREELEELQYENP